MEAKKVKIEVFQVLNRKGECGVQLVFEDKLLGTWSPDEAQLFAVNVRACAETAIEEGQIFRYLCGEMDMPVSQAFSFISGLRKLRGRETGIPQPSYELQKLLHGKSFADKQADVLEDFMKDMPAAIDPKRSN